MVVERNWPSRVEMRVVIRNRSTLREVLEFPKLKKRRIRAALSRRPRTMVMVFISLFSPLATAFASAELTISTTPGMSWNYNMSQELGEGVRFSGFKSDPDGKFRAAVTYRIDGTEKVDGKDLLKFEMLRAGVVTNTDLIRVDARGVVCVARIDLNGEIIKLDPAQIIVGAPLQTGTNWEFKGAIGKTNVHQHYEIIGEEEVEVPAGKFRAFHIHADQTSPNSMTIDRWFVNGSGIVKDVTETRSRIDGTDKLLRRISLELKELPKVTARPEVKPVEGAKKLTATVGKKPIGEALVNFNANTPKIYARWQGHDLRDHAKVRAVWIAENMADDVPPDYTIDDATVIVTAPDSHGIFTLARPDGGWMPGNYRIEFYVDGTPADTVKLKISK
jgi:hypothetical protein